MSIKDIGEKIKSRAATLGTALRGDDLLITAIILLAAFGGFGLGRLSKIKEGTPPVKIYGAGLGATALGIGQSKNTGSPAPTSGVPPAITSTAQNGQYVASKAGTKYHLPWCSGAQRINDANKIWFQSKEEAEKAGYTPAANCKGL